MSVRLFALDPQHLRTAEVCDLLSCGLPTDEAFGDLNALIVRTPSKHLAKLLGVSRSADFDPEAMRTAADSMNRAIVFFGIRAENGRFIGRYADTPGAAFEDALPELRGAAVVPQTVWAKIAVKRGLSSDYEMAAVRRFVEAELDRVLIGYLNESLYEARLIDLIAKRVDRRSGFSSVKEAQAAARKAWPQWRHFFFGTLCSEEPEHAELTCWRDLRGDPSDAGFAVSRDLFDEFLRSVPEDVVLRISDFLNLAEKEEQTDHKNYVCFYWHGINWMQAEGPEFEAVTLNGLKPYAYRLIRLRSVSNEVVNVKGSVISPKLVLEKRSKLRVVTI